jgi:L-alanine-DL-glutamate epimerase-like enolase superfamily enzyme
MSLEITRVESIEFSYELPDRGYTPGGFSLVYEPGGVVERSLFGLRIHTDGGVTGEYVGGSSPAAAQINTFADYLVGADPFARERHWSEVKRALRKYDRMGIGPVDIALWDLAGKYYDAPIHELLGSYRDRIPAYASTYMGDFDGGLDSPEAYADFAADCLAMGYRGFKIHPWSGDWRDVDRTIETVHAVGERVGDEMDLMLDPACEIDTFADALRVGRACDEEGFFWYEDPYRDGGISQHGHRRLRERLDTPLLQTEHVRGLEPYTDFLVSGATDFGRADPEYDGGITGAMKRARIAEGLGLDVEFHAPGPAQRQCLGAIRNANYYELALVHPDVPNTGPPVYLDGYEDSLDSIDDDGTIPIPDGPGLGVTYDWEFIEANRTGSTHVYDTPRL